jgi:hypothetical protein
MRRSARRPGTRPKSERLWSFTSATAHSVLTSAHPCAKAHRALCAAGYIPQVIKTYGCFGTDRLFAGRRAQRLTGNYKVPTLILDDGTVIDDSSRIVAWAEANPRLSPRPVHNTSAALR